MESKNGKLRETEQNVVTRGWEWRKWGDICQRIQPSSYKSLSI